jgi:hypothetical protein
LYLGIHFWFFHVCGVFFVFFVVVGGLWILWNR